MDIEQMRMRQIIIDTLVASGNLSEGVTADLIISAIGAQQCAHARTSETETGDGVPVYFCRDCGENSTEEFKQQSPAVAVPKKMPIYETEKTDMYAKGFRNGFNTCIEEIIELRGNDTQSPRITEQDAREIAGSVIRYCNTRKNVAWDTDSYMRETGRDLLTKLNAKPESVGG